MWNVFIMSIFFKVRQQQIKKESKEKKINRERGRETKGEIKNK
jgi:hypothetical protein